MHSLDVLAAVFTLVAFLGGNAGADPIVFLNSTNATLELLPVTTQVTATTSAFCLTPGCVKVASFILQTSNLSADPCEDFFEYSCGNFLSKSFTSDSDPEGLMQLKDVIAVTDSMQGVAYEYLQEWMLHSNMRLWSERNAVQFYRACLRHDLCEIAEEVQTKTSTKADKTSAEFLNQVANSIGGFGFSLNKTDWNLENLLIAALDYNATTAAPLFKISIDRYLLNPTTFTLTLTHPISSFFFGQQQIFQYRTDDEIEAMKESFAEFLQSLMKLLLPQTSISDEEFMNLVEFDLQLALLIPPFNESALKYEFGGEDLANATIDQLNELCPAINWTCLFQAIGERYDVASLRNSTSLKNLPMVIHGISYFQNLSLLLTESFLNSSTGRKTLQNYIVLYTLQPFFQHLSPRFLELQANLSTAAGLEGGDWDCLSRDEMKVYCFEETKANFGEILSRAFIRRYFTEAAETEVDQMFEKIRLHFLWQYLATVPWIDSDLRKFVEVKVRDIYFANGYEERVMNSTEMERVYSRLMGRLTPNNHLKNMVLVENGTNKYYFKLLDQKVARSYWGRGLTPINVDAEYDPVANSVHLAAANLLEPYFSLDYPKAYNWGSLGGGTLGHEIIHSIDSNGLHFDNRGRLVKDWSLNETVLAAFEEKRQCLVKQYNAIQPVPGNYINGTRTLNENIADTSGLNIAFNAFKAEIGSKLKVAELPGIPLTNEQVFFLATGLSYCKAESRKVILDHLVSDEHSTTKERVLGMMRNSMDFAAAFKCPKGSPMNPVVKCKIW